MEGWEAPKQPSKVVGNKPCNQILIKVVHDAMEQEGVALR